MVPRSPDARSTLLSCKVPSRKGKIVRSPGLQFTLIRLGSGSDHSGARRLGLRIGNLGVDRFTVSAPGETGSVLDAVHDQGTRCVNIGLGSPPTRDEQALIAGALLDE